jgi:hypothetical protein
MQSLTFRVLIKRGALLITGSNRNRNHLELKQAPFRERVQRAVATFVSAVCEHLIQRACDYKSTLEFEFEPMKTYSQSPISPIQCQLYFVGVPTALRNWMRQRGSLLQSNSEKKTKPCTHGSSQQICHREPRCIPKNKMPRLIFLRNPQLRVLELQPGIAGPVICGKTRVRLYLGRAILGHPSC